MLPYSRVDSDGLMEILHVYTNIGVVVTRLLWILMLLKDIEGALDGH